MVLESPITMREICNWEELVDQEEMTTKELMPRGKRTTRELNNMRKKLKDAAQFIGEREQEITKLMKELREGNLTDKKRNNAIEKLEAKQKEVVQTITKLNLNQNKIKRLTNKIKNLADRLTETRNDMQRFDDYFGKYEDVKKLVTKFKAGKMTEKEFKKATKFTLPELERALSNIEDVQRRHAQMVDMLPMTEKEFLSFNDRIVFFEDMILQDKLKLIKANLRLVVSIAKKHAFARNIKHFTHFFQGARIAGVNSKTQADNFGFSFRKRRQHISHFLLAQKVHCRTGGVWPVLIFNKVFQVGILILANWGRKGNRVLHNFQHTFYLFHRQAECFGIIFQGWLTAVFLAEFVSNLSQFGN